MSYRALSILLIKLLCYFFCFFSITLHAQEALAQEKKTLIITNSKAWKPFSYLEHGKPKGLLIDFWRLYGERSGTNIVFNLVDWQESLDQASHGDAHIHAGLVYSKERAELFEFGRVLFNVQSSIYIDINLMGIMKGDFNNFKHPIGLVAGGYEEGFISKLYPNIQLITYANNSLLFEAIRNQEISVFVADKQVTNFYLVSFAERSNDFVAIKPLYDEPIRFAVAKGDFMLLNAVEAQLDMVTKGDIDQIKQKWINTETKVPMWFYSSIFFSLLIAAVAYIYILRKAVVKRTSQLAIANKKLTLQANTDVLTGLYNRRYLMDYLRGMKKKNNIAILLLDIDFFKLINDTYGHAIGDIVLTIFSKRMQFCLNEKGILARIGGEEFCVILEKLTTADMQEISDKLNQKISSSAFQHLEEKFDITVSIGALYIENNLHWSAEEVLEGADKLLYMAKANGRDQTVCGEL